MVAEFVGFGGGRNFVVMLLQVVVLCVVFAGGAEAQGKFDNEPGDAIAVPSLVKKILLVSGKHYYTLAEKRESMGVKDTAIIRVESFCPFPTLELRHEVSKFPNAKVLIWCQEEPQNMGAWTFIKPRFENLIGRKISYCGREPSAAPAVGVKIMHEKQVSDITTKPFLFENDV